MGAEGRKEYTAEFQRKAVALVTEQGYTLVRAARNLGINRDMRRRWKRERARDGTVAFHGKGGQTPEQAELHQLQKVRPHPTERHETSGLCYVESNFNCRFQV